MGNNSFDKFFNERIDKRIKKSLADWTKIQEILVEVKRNSETEKGHDEDIEEIFAFMEKLVERIKLLEIKVEKLEKYGPTLSDGASSDVKHIAPQELIDFRVKNRLSQKNFATLVGATAAMVSKWERGVAVIHPNTEKIIRDYIDMDGQDLIKEFQKKDVFHPSGNKLSKKKSKKQVSRLITAEQIRDLRIHLGMTQKQMAAMCNVKMGTWRNWEYGKSIPPKEIAKKLLKRYEDTLGVIENNSDESSSKDIPSLDGLRERRKIAGLTIKDLAKLIGVSTSSITNWESEKTIPSDEHKEKLIGVLGPGLTESAKDAVLKRKQSIRKKARNKSRYLYPSKALRDFREKYKLTQREMSILMRVPHTRYQKWERPNRGVPPEYNTQFGALQMVLPAEIIQRLKYWSTRQSKTN